MEVPRRLNWIRNRPWRPRVCRREFNRECLPITRQACVPVWLLPVVVLCVSSKNACPWVYFNGLPWAWEALSEVMSVLTDEMLMLIHTDLMLLSVSVDNLDIFGFGYENVFFAM